MRLFLRIFVFIFSIILISCNQVGSKDDSIQRISDYTKPTEDFMIDTGMVQFDTIPKNMTTHQLDSGSQIVIVYKRTGVTMIDANDWEAKYRDFDFSD